MDETIVIGFTLMIAGAAIAWSLWHKAKRKRAVERGALRWMADEKGHSFLFARSIRQPEPAEVMTGGPPTPPRVIQSVARAVFLPGADPESDRARVTSETVVAALFDPAPIIDVAIDYGASSTPDTSPSFDSSSSDSGGGGSDFTGGGGDSGGGGSSDSY